MFLTRIDFFPKYSYSDVKIKTFGGALLSIATISVMVILFCHEFLLIFKPKIQDEIVVDTTRIGFLRTMTISFNMTISSPCNHFNVNAYDVEGTQQTKKHNEIRKQRIDENGLAIGGKEWLNIKKHNEKNKRKEAKNDKTYCGSCYGAAEKGKCCQTCDDVIDAFRAKGWGLSGIDKWEQCIKEGYDNFGKESCLIFGVVRVERAKGTLLFTTIEDVKPGEKRLHDISRVSRSLNLSHTIHYFEIGAMVPGKDNQLTSLSVLQKEKGKMNYKYYLNVVPTKWISTRGFEVNTYKFTATLVEKNMTEPSSRDVPGIYFQYDFQPYSVISRETTYSLWRFIKSVCSIVGGAFACASLADQFLFRALSTLEGKRRIGKDI